VTETLVRDAMVPDPTSLEDSATAQEAGRELSDPEVRAVLVCANGGALVGVVTRKTLVRVVVAAGLDPRTTQLRAIAEPPAYTLEAEMPLDEAFQLVESFDLERVPVVEDGRLVGILSRAVVQRRLAEDEPPPAEADLGD
jgi:CBS domain-containing protein